MREYQENVTRLFDPQTQVLATRYHQDNYGLNDSSLDVDPENRDAHDFMTPETRRILKALNEVPMIKQADSLNYQMSSKHGQSGISNGIRINSQISLTP